MTLGAKDGRMDGYRMGWHLLMRRGRWQSEKVFSAFFFISWFGEAGLSAAERECSRFLYTFPGKAYKGEKNYDTETDGRQRKG